MDHSPHLLFVLEEGSRGHGTAEDTVSGDDLKITERQIGMYAR